MARPKKTIRVETIKQFANEQLAHPNNTLEEKLGIITMLEQVLHLADAYHGYMYLKLGPNLEPPRLYSEEWVARKYF
jgi:hypothetical protein